MPVDPFSTFLLAALTGVAGFLAWLIRLFIADLQAGRDRALTMAEGSTIALDALAAEIGHLRSDLALERRKARSS